MAIWVLLPEVDRAGDRPGQPRGETVMSHIPQGMDRLLMRPAVRHPGRRRRSRSDTSKARTRAPLGPRSMSLSGQLRHRRRQALRRPGRHDRSLTMRFAGAGRVGVELLMLLI